MYIIGKMTTKETELRNASHFGTIFNFVLKSHSYITLELSSVMLLINPCTLLICVVVWENQSEVAVAEVSHKQEGFGPKYFSCLQHALRSY